MVLVAAAFFFTIGGARLLMLGGSAYFLIAGLALLLSGGLIVARRPVGALIFGLVYVATVVWGGVGGRVHVLAVEFAPVGHHRRRGRRRHQLSGAAPV
ncbi:hypothetical protein [Brevundimonas sp.]|uniref:hypothetical protein n=1 Tax=Brevundimonas sp. TaxID=1871086 RepID=UPI003B00B25B